MTAIAHSDSELRRFSRGTLPRLTIAAVLIIPLLYGALYLWAFWDPTGHLSGLPVALVNEDAGAEQGGEPIHLGDDVASQLIADGSLGWVETTADDAAQGVDDGTYYFSVTLPTTFSADVASAAASDPKAASLDVQYNDSNSFLASTLGQSAMAKIDAVVSTEVSTQLTGRVLTGLGQAKDGLTSAADGAAKLSSGLDQAQTGTQTLSDGAASAQEGASALATGLGELHTGTATASSGASKLAAGTTSLKGGAQSLQSGVSQLATGAASAKDGAHALATGLGTLDSSMTQAVTGAQSVASGIDQMGSQVSSVTSAVPALSDYLTKVGGYLAAQSPNDPTAAALLAGLQQIDSALPDDAALAAMSDGLAQLSAGAHQLAESPTAGLPAIQTGVSDASSGATTLASGLDELAVGASTASDGATSLASGATSLDTAAGQLSAGVSSLNQGAGSASEGATRLADGTTQLADGASALHDGTSELSDGAVTLTDALSAGAAKLPSDTPAVQEQRATMIAAPVTLDESHLHQAQGFGEGFAPFFIGLALFVGGIITWLILRVLPARSLAAPVSGLRAVLTGFLPAALLGVGQVVILLAVLIAAIGLEPNALLGTGLFCLLVVCSFLALQQMLSIVLGAAPGKMAALALLMVQLASAGGTYPVETTPEFFRIVSPFLPMSYVVTGLRELITGGIDGRLWGSVAFLALVMVGSLAISAFKAGRDRTWTVARLHPAIAL